MGRVAVIGFSDDELDVLERDTPQGLSSETILGLLHSKGIKLTEATLRKWVQLGLLPRSRRVGLKGGQPGSQGLYPASIVRRIQRLRTMMEQHTIDEIKHQFLYVQGDVEELERTLERIFGQLAGAAEGGPESELGEARRLASELISAISGIEARIASS
jgi:DNA-binding transcriptional MerR regulator